MLPLGRTCCGPGTAALTAADGGAGAGGAGTGDAGAAVGAEAVVPTFSPALYSRSSATNSSRRILRCDFAALPVR